ncbi:MAG: PEP-CTERM sorting domain-containing protein [Gammaproteobacteria bacterium]
MNKFKQILAGGLLSLMASNAIALVSPPPINGTLQMIGASYLLDAQGNTTSDATSAVAIDFTPNKFITTAANGSFSGLTNQVGYIQDLDFGSFAGPVTDFWIIDIFSFKLTDVLAASMNTDNSSFLSLEGSGVISAAGFEDTVASWSFTANSAGGSLFGWSATSNADVPEPGILALLSLGLITIAVRRKIKV